jgi:hypothetical protein
MSHATSGVSKASSKASSKTSSKTSGVSKRWAPVLGLVLLAKALTHAVSRLSLIARDEILFEGGDPRASVRRGPS